MLIDVHAHIGRILFDRREFVDAANLIARMDAWGIDISFVLALSEHSEAPYLEATTEDVITACSHYPKRLIPFCTIDPRFAGNNPKADFRWLLDEYKSRGCRGIGEMLPKLHFDDARCINLFKQAGEFEMPVLFDAMDSETSYGLVAGPGLHRLETTLQECPKTIFIGHGPTFWAEISSDVPSDQRWGYPKGTIVPGGAVPKLMRRYHNLWIDISAGSGHNALTRDPQFGLAFLQEFQDRTMFGTDACRRSDLERGCPNVTFFLGLREGWKLPESAWEKIAWRNAVRLLKLPILEARA